MTIKGNLIYVTVKEIEAAGIGAAALNELDETLLNSGYELAVENINAK